MVTKKWNREEMDYRIVNTLFPIKCKIGSGRPSPLCFFYNTSLYNCLDYIFFCDYITQNLQNIQHAIWFIRHFSFLQNVQQSGQQQKTKRWP